MTQKVPAVLSQRREGGVYPLMAAVRNDAIVVVKLLLSLEVDLEVSLGSFSLSFFKALDVSL